MKKAVLLISVFSFITLASKAQKPANNNTGYIVMNVSKEIGEIFVTDGNNTLDEISLRYEWSNKQVRENLQTVAKELNNLKSKGYELVSSNGDRYSEFYVLEKK